MKFSLRDIHIVIASMELFASHITAIRVVNWANVRMVSISAFFVVRTSGSAIAERHPVQNEWDILSFSDEQRKRP